MLYFDEKSHTLRSTIVDSVKFTALECFLPKGNCLAVGSTRLASIDIGPAKFSADFHYNLYKLSCADFEGQRKNTEMLLKYYGVSRFVSTALFHGTTDVVYASKNGLRILGPGKGKRAIIASNYLPYERSQQLPADGIICEPKSNIVPITYSADCVTGVFSAPNGAYGVFHSMAKKLADSSDNIIRNMILAFNKLYGLQAEDLQLAIFPSASPDIYEVDEDFAANFNEHFVIREEGKKPRLKLEEAAVAIARQLGVYDIATTGRTTAWTGLESLRGSEKATMANGSVGNANGQNIVFAVPFK